MADTHTHKLTSENDLKKLARWLFGDGVNAFCRRTWFSSSRCESFSSRLIKTQQNEWQEVQLIKCANRIKIYLLYARGSQQETKA